MNELAKWFKELNKETGINITCMHDENSATYHWGDKNDESIYIMIGETINSHSFNDDQIKMLKLLDKAHKSSNDKFMGTWLIRFENTTPENGKTFVNLLSYKGENHHQYERQVNGKQVINLFNLEWDHNIIGDYLDEKLFNSIFN